VTDDQDPYDEDDDDEPFDHGGCYMPHVRNGEYVDCDGRPI